MSLQTKGELTRERIVVEATRLVKERGFKATSINDLVAATGLKKGCLYFHFSGKDELLDAILEQAKTDFFRLVDAALEGGTPGDRLNNFFDGVLEFQKSMGFSGGCIFGNIALEMSDKDARVAAFIKDIFYEWIARIRAVVEAAQRAGQVATDIDAGILASHIVMTLEGGIMLSRLEKTERPLTNCLTSLRLMIGLKNRP